jgi:hypothetical protein
MDDTKKSDRQAEQSQPARRAAPGDNRRTADAIPSGPALTNPGEPQLWSTDDFAVRLKCSPRHLRRLVDAGRAPAPVRLGALVRFNATVAAKWIADGCPDQRKGGVR